MSFIYYLDECLQLKAEKEKLIEENEGHKKEVQRLNREITNISSMLILSVVNDTSPGSNHIPKK